MSRSQANLRPDDHPPNGRAWSTSPTLLVDHHRRYSSIIAKAVEVIRSGALGGIVAVVGTALFYKAESEGYFDGQFA